MPIRQVKYNPTSSCFDGNLYDQEDLEFIRAMAAYIKTNKRRFPTFVEVFHVALSLGYRKVAAPVPLEPLLPAIAPSPRQPCLPPIGGEKA